MFAFFGNSEDDFATEGAALGGFGLRGICPGDRGGEDVVGFGGRGGIGLPGGGNDRKKLAFTGGAGDGGGDLLVCDKEGIAAEAGDLIVHIGVFSRNSGEWEGIK